MTSLLRRPGGPEGKIVDITPENAGWRHVGFAVHALRAGATAGEAAGNREVILVMIEGKARLATPEQDFGVQGERMNVFEWKKPHAVYVPNGTSWSARAVTDCAIAVCSAPGSGGHAAAAIDPGGIPVLERTRGANTRYIHPIAMDDADVADSLLVTEVLTPQGNWSSYPPHRHDADEGNEMTRLEETYYFRIDPPQGFGFQRVFTERAISTRPWPCTTGTPSSCRAGTTRAARPTATTCTI